VRNRIIQLNMKAQLHKEDIKWIAERHFRRVVALTTHERTIAMILALTQAAVIHSLLQSLTPLEKELYTEEFGYIENNRRFQCSSETTVVLSSTQTKFRFK